MIHYFCPDLEVASSGMRLLYKHVDILNRHGVEAGIVHQKPPFRLRDVPDVPIRYLSAPWNRPGDIFVVPEGWPYIVALEGRGLIPVMIALNWKLIYAQMEGGDWRNLGVRHALANSPFIGQMIAWTMGIEWHLVTMGVDPTLYPFEPEQKLPQIAYIARKAPDVTELQRVLFSRNPAFVQNIVWKPLQGLSQAEYAREICRSQIFLNVSHFEGFPFSLMEAMHAGTLVAGYNSVGGQYELVGAGPMQNCILAENVDYVTLAQRLEPALAATLRRDLTPWAGVIRNARALSERFSLEREEQTAWEAWQKILATR